MAPGWPPAAKFGKDIVAARGAQLLPTSRAPMGYDLLLGYRVREPYRFGARDSITITYRVGATTYVFTQRARIVVCPPGRSSAACTAYADRIYPDG